MNKKTREHIFCLFVISVFVFTHTQKIKNKEKTDNKPEGGCVGAFVGGVDGASVGAFVG
jgi:hypothetical protein